MKKFYRFAGIDLEIEVPDGRMYLQDRHLAPFRVDHVENPHSFRFDLTQALAPPQGQMIYCDGAIRVYRTDAGFVRYIGSVQDGWETAYIRADDRDRVHVVQLRADLYPGPIPVKSVLNSLWTEHLVAENSGFVFHCSYVEHGGKAILFTAPSGTGKSTQADLWRENRGANIVNGDRAVLRYVDGAALAQGLPFAGSSVYCANRTLPIGAIVYLSQAPVTTIRGLRGYEAFARIWEGVSVNPWNRRDLAMVSETVRKIAGAVPVFHLACTPDESAVEALELALRKQENL